MVSAAPRMGNWSRMSGERRVRSYRFVRLPWWIRAVVIGVFLGAGMFVVALIGDDDSDVLGELVGAAAAALVFAIAGGLFMRAFERRLFMVDGRMLTWYGPSMAEAPGRLSAALRAAGR